MKSSTKLLSVLLLANVVFASPKPDETLFLFENRKLAIAVPEGFGYRNSKDELGMMNVQLAVPSDKVAVHLVFLPDPDGEFLNARARKEKIVELFQEYVDSSVEKAMQFEELEPATGVGTYCVFTDTKLVGKAKLPPGEYLHFTTGLKAWPGVLAIFRVFSNDTTSPEYQATMKMLRQSVQEKGVPLK
jgi:hypothetical protein